MTDSSDAYLRDLGDLLWALADRARQSAGADDHARGRALGLYEAVSLMEQQAAAFGLSAAEVGLEGRSADHLLRDS